MQILVTFALVALSTAGFIPPVPGSWPPMPPIPGSGPSPGSGSGGAAPGLPPSTTSTKYTATFDDLDYLTDDVAVQEVGPYDGLEYSGIDLLALGLAGTVTAGVIPHSDPNVGAYGETTDAIDGAPYISTQYSGSTTDTFDFHHFWFGCEEGTVEGVSSSYRHHPIIQKQ